LRSNALQKLSETGHLEVEVTQYSRDGRRLLMQSRIQTIQNERGQVTGYVAALRDLSESKRAEEELRRSEALLAEGQRLSHTGSWVWNVFTRELLWSLEHFRICGVDPANFKVTLDNVEQLIHPEDRKSVMEAFYRRVDEGRQFERDFRMVRPDGTFRHVHSLGRPVFNHAGQLIEFVGTILDTTERKQEEEARKELLRRLVFAQEDERRRISREMHDQLGQQMSVLNLKLADLKREHSGEGTLSEQLESLEKIVRKLDYDVDFIAWQLRPTELDDLGLASALANYLKSWSEHFGIRAELHASGMERSRVTGEMEITLYRLVQESLNNIAKHSRAKNVAILLEARPEQLSLIVEDDGVGFDAEQAFSGSEKGFGLSGMRERAALLGGSVNIESYLGKGATVVVRIPNPRPQNG
jgi:PAS domain S-box-containing protein